MAFAVSPCPDKRKLQKQPPGAPVEYDQGTREKAAQGAGVHGYLPGFGNLGESESGQKDRHGINGEDARGLDQPQTGGLAQKPENARSKRSAPLFQELDVHIRDPAGVDVVADVERGDSRRTEHTEKIDPQELPAVCHHFQYEEGREKWDQDKRA